MKRNLIITILACGASALLTTGAFAQATPDLAAPTTSGTTMDGGQAGGPLLKRLTYALGLTGSQQAEIAPILEAAKPQLQAIREQAKTARDGVINNVVTQVNPLLTGTQQAKFAEMVQHLEQGPGPGGPGSPGAPDGPGHHRNGIAQGGGAGKLGGGKFNGADQLQHLTTALNLTADQQTQIKPILDAAHAQVRTIFQNASLTPQQKFTQVKDVLEAANGQINGILTPAQQSAFAALKQQRYHRHAPAAGPSPTTTGS
jgi:Spy/CpxP family protein refolding chaperone